MNATPMALLLLSVLGLARAQHDLASLVRTTTGTLAGGNTFPGVSRPMGMVKLGPDLFNGADSYSGFQPDGNFSGFSMLHESGTGGAPKYGVVTQMPVVDTGENPLLAPSVTRAKDDVTEVGYYRSELASGIRVELAATDKAGLYQYTFPDNSKDFGVVVDVSHVLSSYRGMRLEQHYLGGEIEVREEDGGFVSYIGYGDYDNGWNKAERWRVYFCGHFDRPATFQTFRGYEPSGDRLERISNDHKVAFSRNRLGAIFTFKDKKVLSRVGVSFRSTKQACGNVRDEIPQGTKLEEVKAATRKDWEDKVLSKVTTTDKDPEKLARLYSALYFMNLLPTNKTGENPRWESNEPYYDDIFTFWDTFRCTTSLFHILLPEAYEELIRSWVDIWRHEGFMSDARSSFYNGAVQAGSNVDNVFADAYVKGVRGKIDWDDAYQAMVTDAEVVPPVGSDNRDPGGSAKEGRGALRDWLDYGYITKRFARSVTRAVEYAVNDFALYQVASGLRHRDDAEKYLDRSRNWRNHWNTDMEALNHTGFLGPIDTNGRFVPQDPLSCGGCYWGDDYYQGLPWEYTFNAHHDLTTLIEWSGGEAKFVDRLELTFKPGMVGGNAQFGRTIFNPGNEPSFGTPYLYNFVRRQDLSVLRSRFVAKSYFSPTPDGLPGNSDAGAMESWLLWNMIGMYPLTGQTTFLIGSPWFDDLTIDLGGGRKLEITTTGGSEDSFYVQSLKVNGKRWDRNWVAWDDVFARGGRMDFELGPEPKVWDTGPLPPSPAFGAGKPPPPRGSWLSGNMMSGALIGMSVLASAGVIFLFFRMKARRGTGDESGPRRGAGATAPEGYTSVRTGPVEGSSGYADSSDMESPMLDLDSPAGSYTQGGAGEVRGGSERPWTRWVRSWVL